MDVRESYDQWSARYDLDPNRTRDLEASALRTVLGGQYGPCLEIGCGTGKNTLWLAERCSHVTAVDLSPGMLAIARAKVTATTVTFKEGDLRGAWSFAHGAYDLIVLSLVLEHIEHLVPVMQKAAAQLAPGGRIHIGELHPFKQYLGTKARFDAGEGIQVVPCFVHHISDFVQAARLAGLRIQDVQEFFDAENGNGLPRLLVLDMRK